VNTGIIPPQGCDGFMAVRLPEAPYCLLYWSGPRRRAAKNFYRARPEKVLAKYGNQFLKLKANP
jgi:hypothetical protein